MKYRYFVYFLKNKSKWALFAVLIRFCIKREYNHVEVVCVPEIETMLARFYGAVVPVSRMTGAREIDSKYELVKMIELKDFKQYSALDNIKWLDSMCGIPYSPVQIALQLAGAVSFYLKQKLSKSRLNCAHLLICTELAARFMGQRMGYKFTTAYDACEFEDIIKTYEGA